MDQDCRIAKLIVDGKTNSPAVWRAQVPNRGSNSMGEAMIAAGIVDGANMELRASLEVSIWISSCKAKETASRVF
jgi:hypothetical protein